MSSSPASEAGPSSSNGPTPTPQQEPPENDYPLNVGRVSLREPPGEDLPRPTLNDFRNEEGPAVRAAKLRTLWQSLPRLPPIEGDQPTATARMRLPDQDTLTALSPERAERLRILYQEELVRQCGEKRPDARLWGGSDDLEPVDVREKGISWKAFR